MDTSADSKAQRALADSPQTLPATSEQGSADAPARLRLSESAEVILWHLRELDRGNGCRMTMRQIGRSRRGKVSERQTRRIVANLVQLGLIRDGGRVPGGPRILHVQPRQAAQS